jgi:hypothetical protein
MSAMCHILDRADIFQLALLIARPVRNDAHVLDRVVGQT